MSAYNDFSNRGLKHVRPWTYPNTFAIIGTASLMAEQATNRDSASWKKAEHIIVDEYQSDGGTWLLPFWHAFISASPGGSPVEQKLYINVGCGRYVVYNEDGRKIGEGRPSEIIV